MDRITFSQMRFCHLHEGKNKIRFWVYDNSLEQFLKICRSWNVNG